MVVSFVAVAVVCFKFLSYAEGGRKEDGARVDLIIITTITVKAAIFSLYLVPCTGSALCIHWPLESSQKSQEDRWWCYSYFIEK